MIHSDPVDDQQNDQHPEGQRHDVIEVVGARRDMDEKDEVNAHLGDRENSQRDGYAGSQTSVVCAIKKDTMVSSVASPRPIR